MKSSGSIIINSVLVVLVIGILLGSQASATPPGPRDFYGTLNIGGSPAPVETGVQGIVDGEDRTLDQISPYTTDVEGEYGSTDPFGNKFILECSNGEIVSFNIEVSPGVFALADQIYECNETTVNLDLTVGGIICTDSDGDGYGDPASPNCLHPELDCDDSDPEINPGATETCDGVDNDCDTDVDEGFDLGAACTVGVGECETSGVLICTVDGLGTECDATPGEPSTEICDGLDNDCDGSIDNGFPDLGAACTVGVGECEASGVYVCTQDGLGTECDATPGEPSTEICDGLDNDCDGETDEGDVCATCTDLDGDGYGNPASPACTHPELDCDDSDPDVNPGEDEICDNGIDDDCDGDTDFDDSECYCIEITSLRVLDSDFNPATEILLGAIYHIEVTNENMCDFDVTSMQIVEMEDEGETTINLGTVTSTIEAFDSNVITFGFILPPEIGAGNTMNVNAFNWNQWITQPGPHEVLSETESTGFTTSDVIT